MFKKYIFAFLIAGLFLLQSCKKAEQVDSTRVEKIDTKKSQTERGEQLFENEGNCIACHNPAQKIVGPSLKEIAAAYKGKSGEIVAFLKGNAKPIVDPAQYDIMKANFAITKNMSENELNALESYIYSHLKQ